MTKRRDRNLTKSFPLLSLTFSLALLIPCYTSSVNIILCVPVRSSVTVFSVFGPSSELPLTLRKVLKIVTRDGED